MLAVCVLALVCGSMATLPALIRVHPKFEFKYSFKGPYLINKQGNVPFWNYGGSEEGGREGVGREEGGEGGREGGCREGGRGGGRKGGREEGRSE